MSYYEAYTDLLPHSDATTAEDTIVWCRAYLHWLDKSMPLSGSYDPLTAAKRRNLFDKLIESHPHHAWHISHIAGGPLTKPRGRPWAFSSLAKRDGIRKPARRSSRLRVAELRPPC